MAKKLKERLDQLNVEIPDAEKAYNDYCAGIPTNARERNADQTEEKKRLFEALDALYQERDEIREDIRQDAELRARRLEFESGREEIPGERATATDLKDAYGTRAHVEDKAVYQGRFAIGEQICDMWHHKNRPGTQRGQEASRRLREMEQRRIAIMHRYHSRADYPTQQEAVVSKGGIFLETERSFELMTHGFNNGVLASRCRRMSMGGAVRMHEIYGFWENSRKDEDRYAGLRFVPMEELEKVVRQAMDFENLFKIQPRKLGAGFNMSEELAEDVPMVESIVRDLFSQSWARDLDWYIWNANGGKEPGVGIINSQALYTQPKESSQANYTLVNENIDNMMMHLPAESWNSPSLLWVWNQFLLTELRKLFIPAGDGGELSMAFRMGDSPTGLATILGKTAIPIEHTSAVGTAGDIGVVDLNKMLITDKGGMKTASSVEVEFWAGQKSVKLWTEIDIQPLWKDTVQVYNDEAGREQYVSPFVILGDRKP